jgi:hypothetical protein
VIRNRGWLPLILAHRVEGTSDSQRSPTTASRQKYLFLQVADEFGLAAENLYVYASRLRSHIRAGAGADLHDEENVA